MALKKRGAVWWVDITSPSGERVRHSAKTGDPRQAKEYHDTLKARLWRSSRLGETPSRLWEEAALRWLREKEGKKNYANYIRFWTEHFKGKPLEMITRDLASAAIEKEEMAPGTKNRYVACLRAILRAAQREWEWTKSTPAFRLYGEPNIRVRWITKEEALRLIESCPDYLKAPVIFAFATGLRQANVLNLEWSQIRLTDGVAWIHGDQAKAGKPIPVALNREAVEALQGQIGKDQRFVFPRDGKTMRQVQGKPWKRICKKAGIEDFRFHDIRHTWASWHVQAGTPLHVLQEMGGWSDPRMVKKYAHFAPHHLKSYAENLGTFSFHQKREGVKVAV